MKLVITIFISLITIFGLAPTTTTATSSDQPNFDLQPSYDRSHEMPVYGTPCPPQQRDSLTTNRVLPVATTCIDFGESCVPNDPKKPCCDGTFCHTRYGPDSYSCVHTAFIREKCCSANGGIPCEAGSTCVNGQCALRFGDGCDEADSVCSPGLRCQHVPLYRLVNKECR